MKKINRREAHLSCRLVGEKDSTRRINNFTWHAKKMSALQRAGSLCVCPLAPITRKVAREATRGPSLSTTTTSDQVF